jgi:hypothetical protein
LEIMACLGKGLGNLSLMIVVLMHVSGA